MSEKQPPNRQTARSRRMLQAAFLELLYEKPYPKITVAEISERADLARSTFYAHFETKDDLLVSYVDDFLMKFFKKITERNYKNNDKVTDIKINIQFFQIWQECCEMETVIQSVDIDHIILKRIRMYWDKYYENLGLKFSPLLNPALAKYLHNFLTYTFFSILKQWLADDKKFPPDVMGELLYELTGPPVLINVIEKF